MDKRAKTKVTKDNVERLWAAQVTKTDVNLIKEMQLGFTLDQRPRVTLLLTTGKRKTKTLKGGVKDLFQGFVELL